MSDRHRGSDVARARGEGGLPDSIAQLADADRTSVLMAAMATASIGRRASDIVRRYAVDRFVRPGSVEPSLIREAERHIMSSIGGAEVALAPLVPFGTHAVLGSTPQDNVISTIRGTEVAADPTTGLVLEAATRRRDPMSRSADTDLCGIQRVTRAQRFEGAESYAHFVLAARVTVARIRPGLVSELVIRHVDEWTAAITACGLEPLVTLTDFSGTHGAAIEAIVEQTGAELDPGRIRGRDYYESVVFEVTADGMSVGDGGFVDWAAKLGHDAKERTLTSAVGVDRIAARLR